MAKKKDFTTADEAIDKFFTQPQNIEINQNTDILDDHQIPITTNDGSDSTTNDNIAKSSHKSKHYDERGKRNKRYVLMMDEQLRKDLTHMSKITDSKSVNDFILTVLLEYIGEENNQAKLKQYRKILNS